VQNHNEVSFQNNRHISLSFKTPMLQNAVQTAMKVHTVYIKSSNKYLHSIQKECFWKYGIYIKLLFFFNA